MRAVKTPTQTAEYELSAGRTRAAVQDSHHTTPTRDTAMKGKQSHHNRTNRFKAPPPPKQPTSHPDTSSTWV